MICTVTSSRSVAWRVSPVQVLSNSINGLDMSLLFSCVQVRYASLCLRKSDASEPMTFNKCQCRNLSL